MLVATTEKLAGYTTKQSLGQVFGLVVRSRGLGVGDRGRRRPGDDGDRGRLGQNEGNGE